MYVRDGEVADAGESSEAKRELFLDLNPKLKKLAQRSRGPGRALGGVGIEKDGRRE